MSESVDLIASGYEWVCPKDSTFNKTIELSDTVKCHSCGEVYEVGNFEHTYEGSGRLCDVFARSGHEIPRRDEIAEINANARLIAAAPELLNVAKAVLNLEQGMDGDKITLSKNAALFSLARAAIAKATRPC